uniref:RNA-directed RNA polymerase n=1 Tax=Leviviridae sp. TaxID=2027243 RepID=A0A514D8U5_9VIRU|nr:MAG: RNA-dependent RNA polymerase [Leviviridae sp.]
MLSDIADRMPSLRVECERDYKRLLSAVEHHGITFLCDTMPAFSKHLDKCLETGRLTRSGLCHFRPYLRKSTIPRLFKGLLLRVFDLYGVLRSDPDSQALGYVRQLCSLAKRFRVTCSDSATWRQVDEFFKTDGEIRQPSLDWDIGDFDSERASHLQFGDDLRSEPEFPLFREIGTEASPSSSIDWDRCLEAVQRTADILCSQLGRFDPLEWKTRHGPGAVSDLKDKTYKYIFPSWSPKLEKEFPSADFASSNYLHYVTTYSHGAGGQSPLWDHEPPARLLAVPKSFTAPRLIASEPVSHQWCQQGIREFIMSRVSDSWISKFISFRDQTGNQKLALEASRDSSLATIDLSSASDRLSCWFVERCFRRSPSLLSAFYAVRTRWIRQDLDRCSPKFYRLRKFSTMGSALTFPVQSVSFLAVVLGVTLYERNLRPTIKNIAGLDGQVRVFGDDIVAPSDCSATVVATLERLGFKVNPSKTFQTGLFRESCGVEAFSGNDVTKVSVLSMPSVSAPESVLSILDSHNNFFKKGYYRVCEYLRKSVERLGRFSFPDVEPDSGAIGWYSFDPWSSNVRLSRRWNPILQRREYRVTLPQSGFTKTPVDSDSMLLQYFTEVNKPPISREERLGRSALRHPLRLRWVWASGLAA